MKFAVGLTCGFIGGVALTSYATLRIITRDKELKEGLVNAVSTKMAKVLYGSDYRPQVRRGGYIDYRRYQSQVSSENN